MRRRLGLKVCAVGLAIGLSAARGAAAQAIAALPLELQWQAPSECPSGQDVRDELARIASAAPGEDLRPLAARITVARGAGRYTAQLRTEHEGLVGERTLEAADCKTLVRSVTLVLALAFGRGVELHDEASSAPASTGATPAPTAAPSGERTGEATPKPASQEPVDAARRSDEDESAEEPDTPPDVHLGFVLGGGAQLTLMPALAPVLRAGATLRIRALSIELRAALMPQTTQDIDRDASARFDALMGTALGCFDASWAALCAGARVAAIRARTRGLSDDAAATAPWYALALAAQLAWPEHSPFQVGLEGLLALSLTRPRFEVTGLGRTHRVPLFAPELSAFLRVWL